MAAVLSEGVTCLRASAPTARGDALCWIPGAWRVSRALHLDDRVSEKERVMNEQTSTSEYEGDKKLISPKFINNKSACLRVSGSANTLSFRDLWFSHTWQSSTCHTTMRIQQHSLNRHLVEVKLLPSVFTPTSVSNRLW